MKLSRCVAWRSGIQISLSGCTYCSRLSACGIALTGSSSTHAPAFRRKSRSSVHADDGTYTWDHIAVEREGFCRSYGATGRVQVFR